jgi:transglutaminase-like putative cysteine protease
MLFEILHRMDYRYGQPAREAYIEARLTPPILSSQEILAHEIEFFPPTPVSVYKDYFGNQVTFYSMTLRHERLTIVNRLTVRTKGLSPTPGSLDVTVAEARQLFASKLTDVFDYLQPTPTVPTGIPSMDWARKFFPGGVPLGEALERLNRAVHERFRYLPGSTDNWTPLETVWKQRAGVCQDFTHVMLGVLRTAGIPSRYVCGYIESDPVKPAPGASRLVGSLATHAWVEALTPGMRWLAIDPTNNQWCGARHVTMAYGRDSVDATPVRGTFKGSGAQNMKIRVSMKRLAEKP